MPLPVKSYAARCNDHQQYNTIHMECNYNSSSSTPTSRQSWRKCPFFTFMWPTVHRHKLLYNKTNQMHQSPKFTPAWNSTCSGKFLCPTSGVYSLYTRHWYMSYRFEDSFRAGLWRNWAAAAAAAQSLHSPAQIGASGWFYYKGKKVNVFACV